MSKEELKIMNKNLKAIGEEILEQERLCLEQLGRGLKDANFGGRYENQYYAEVGQNLWAGVPQGEPLDTYPHFTEYGRGSGGELKDSTTPAKMKSIRSSSAMTYNLLGNKRIDLIAGKGIFSEGTYSIEYEKQLYTIKRNLQPANLDAFLYNGDNNEGIFCEMKMMEWIFNEPGELKEAYENVDLYYTNCAGGEKAVQAFQKAIYMLKGAMLACTGEGHFFRYDAWQMFKHTLGIYNMTSSITKAEMSRLCENSSSGIKMLPKCEKVTLVNVVFEPEKEILSDGLRDTYGEVVRMEHENFKLFRQIMIDSGVVKVFEVDCDIDFDIQYMTAAEFMDCFDLGDRKDYLERYRLSLNV